MKKIWFNRRVHVQFFNLKKSKNRKTKVECGDRKICMVVVFAKFAFTDKSFSESLILASIYPQYDKRLFIELHEKYKIRTCCVHKQNKKKLSVIYGCHHRKN